MEDIKIHETKEDRDEFLKTLENEGILKLYRDEDGKVCGYSQDSFNIWVFNKIKALEKQ